MTVMSSSVLCGAAADMPGSGSDGSDSPMRVGARREGGGVADDIGGGVSG